MKKSLRFLAPVAAIGLAVLLPGVASASSSTTYQAKLNPLNHVANGFGSATVTINGNQAMVSEQVTGLAAMFMGAPYPHAQHIHGMAMGECPSATADKNDDQVVSTTEGAPFYGPITTTLSTSGDTSPKAALNLKTAPSGGSYTYRRMITLDAATLATVRAGKGVIVVHGLDPATLSKKAQGEKSDLAPTLPLAATSPALCGALVASQTSRVPGGAANTGGGGTAGLEDGQSLALGGVLLLASGAVFALRRRFASES